MPEAWIPRTNINVCEEQLLLNAKNKYECKEQSL